MSDGKSAAYILAQNPPPSHLAKAAATMHMEKKNSGKYFYTV